MKKLAALIVVVITCSITLYAQSPYVSITKIDSAIDNAIVKELSILKEDFIHGIKSNDKKLLESLWSEQFKETAGANLDTFIDQLHFFLMEENLSVDHMYYTKVVTKENPIRMTIIPEVTTDLPMINSAEIYGNQSFSFFIETTKDMNQYLLFLSFGRFNQEWKVVTVGFGNYKIANMSAPLLYEKIQNLKSDKKQDVAVYYALALRTCLRPVYFLQYQNEAAYIKAIENEFQAINERYAFPFMLGDMQVIGLDIQLTDSEGITPIVKYITDVELNRDSLDIEISNAWPEILNRFSGLETEFEHIVFQAYHEMPSNPKQQYHCFNTIISLRDDMRH